MNGKAKKGRYNSILLVLRSKLKTSWIKNIQNGVDTIQNSLLNKVPFCFPVKSIMTVKTKQIIIKIEFIFSFTRGSVARLRKEILALFCSILCIT
jgi:hypothetical protein